MLASVSSAAVAANSEVENLIGRKIDEIAVVRRLNLREHITFVGQTGVNEDCHVTVYKDPRDLVGSDDELIGVEIGEGNFALLEESREFLSFHTKGKFVENRDDKRYFYALKETPKSLAFSVEVTTKTGWFDRKKSLSQMKLDIDKGEIVAATYSFQGNDERTFLTCRNLKPLAVRQTDYNGGVNFGSGDNLLEFCRFHYSSVCPNDVHYNYLPKSLGKLNVCTELSKAGKAESEEAQMCNPLNSVGNLR